MNIGEHQCEQKSLLGGKVQGFLSSTIKGRPLLHFSEMTQRVVQGAGSIKGRQYRCIQHLEKSRQVGGGAAIQMLEKFLKEWFPMVAPS